MCGQGDTVARDADLVREGGKVTSGYGEKGVMIDFYFIDYY